MEFKELKELLQKNFEKMTKNTTHLFEVDLDKDVLYNLYLDSFPEGTNPVFRERREFDCSACKNFIRNIGNTVVIVDGNVSSIWDFNTGDPTFQPVIDALSAFVKSKTITDMWLSQFYKIGTSYNNELVDGKIEEWHHFALELPTKFVNKSGKSLGDIKGSFRDVRNVFKRSLDTITEDSILTVQELTAQGSLYKGEEWKTILQQFLKYKKEYTDLDDEAKEIHAWEKAATVGPVIGKIRNHSIGTLLIDISEGVDLDKALKSYEKITAPTNYKRPNAIFTQKMLEDAKKTMEELGFLDSLERRYAILDDINVTNILFSNKDSVKRMVGGESFFDELTKTVAINPKNFGKVEEVTIDTFINDILPGTTELELFFENKHTGNLVSLIAPKDPNAKTMFKWNNGFSWAYSGNITDSMKEQVKAAGGNVEGVLRFSIRWNDDINQHDPNDLDAHCKEPGGNLIYYSSKNNRNTTGSLDIDIITPVMNRPAVENITWSNKSKMEIGDYIFYTHGFGIRGKSGGFRAEIEFDGQIHSFDYQQEVKVNEKVKVATVTLHEDGTFTVKNHLSSTASSKTVWGIATNQFIPVSVAMYSPNYWNEQQGIGHRHYMFMLKDCVNPETPSGMFNEFLNNELIPHRKVMEAMSSKMRVEDMPEQLSGCGFSSTKRAEVLVKVVGQVKRMLKIKI